MKKNKLALIVLLLGIFSFINLFGLEKGLMAMIAGCLALQEIKNEPTLRGKKLVWTGIILGALSMATIFALIIWKGPQFLHQLKNLSKMSLPR